MEYTYIACCVMFDTSSKTVHIRQAKLKYFWCEQILLTPPLTLAFLYSIQSTSQTITADSGKDTNINVVLLCSIRQLLSVYCLNVYL